MSGHGHRPGNEEAFFCAFEAYRKADPDCRFRVRERLVRMMYHSAPWITYRRRARRRSDR